jgi:hypothetical protein
LNTVQKEQSIDRGNLRRRSMADISERLAGLTAVQHSTDAVLDSLNYKLEAKLRTKVDTSVDHRRVPAVAEARGAWVGAEQSQSTFNKREREEIQRLMARAELQEPEEEVYEGEQDELDEPPAPPAPRSPYGGSPGRQTELLSSASPHRVLNISYSSREEDDAPEIGAMSEEEGEYYASDSDGFHDAYEDDDDADPEPQSSAHQPKTLAHNRATYLRTRHPEQVGQGNCDEDEYWEYQSDSGYEHGAEDHVPVHTAQRHALNLAGSPSARRPMMPPPRQGPIYADEDEDDNIDQFEEGGHSTRANQSTLSSVYSNSIVDFLSPEPARRSSPQRDMLDDDEANGSGEELIVIRSSSKEAGLNNTGGSFSRGSTGSRMFEVQSARIGSPGQSLLPGSGGATGSGSPSRSLFDGATERPPPPPSPGLRHAAHRSPDRGAQHSSPHRVVLQLDELEL